MLGRLPGGFAYAGGPPRADHLAGEPGNARSTAPRRGGAASRDGGSPAVLAALIALALAALAVPVALVPVPPVLDYPNHLARLCLLAGGADTPPLSGMYAIDWAAATTNIGTDLLGAVLGPFVGCEALGRVLLAATFVLPPLGAVALSAALFRGLHWWQIGFAVLAWNNTAVAGFMSFQISLGLALLAAAADRGVAVRTSAATAFGLRAAMGAAIFVCHVFGGVFYGALLAALAIGAEPVAWWRDGAALFRRLLRGVGRASAGFGVPLLLFLLLAPVAPGAEVAPADSYAWTGYGAAKIMTLLSPVLTYWFVADAAFVAGLWAAARLAAVRELLRVHGGLLFAACGLALLALAMPMNLGGATSVDWRFAVMSALALAVSVQPGMRGPRASLLAAVFLAALSLGRSAWIGGVWLGRQPDAVAVERTLRHLPPGSALLPARHVDSVFTAPLGRFVGLNWTSGAHYSVLAIPRRQAFVPTLFSMPGLQPLRVRPPWDALAVPVGGPAPIHLLLQGVEGLRAYGWDRPTLPPGLRYLDDWERRFDHVLLLNADRPHHGDDTLPSSLELVADEGFAKLYRIRRDP